MAPAPIWDGNDAIVTEGVPPELLVDELPPQPARDNIPNIRIKQVRGEEAEIRTNTSLGNTLMRKLSDEAGCNAAVGFGQLA